MVVLLQARTLSSDCSMSEVARATLALAVKAFLAWIRFTISALRSTMSVGAEGGVSVMATEALAMRLAD